MKVKSIKSTISMKAFFLLITCLLLLGAGSSFARERLPINDRVQESFKKEFTGAQFVKWAETGEYMKATFVLAGHRAEAYFTRDGEFQGCIRDLFFDQLPLSVMKAIDNRFAKADILDVREVTNPEGTSYLVSLEHLDRKYRVKSDAEGNLVEVEKGKK